MQKHTDILQFFFTSCSIVFPKISMKSSHARQKELFKLLKAEVNRQKKGIHLIASENDCPPEVLKLVGSPLINKYAEGYPGKRYYSGNQYCDEIEKSAIEAAKRLFNAPHANVQPHSGSTANAIILDALLKKKDTILALALDHGGHLTHGHLKNFSGKEYNFVHYHVNPLTQRIDFDEVEVLAQKHSPRLIICGYTSYPRAVDFERFGKIARKYGAFAMADISHIAGLVATGLHSSPFPAMDVVMTTTHKTLRGPRGAIILCTKELAQRIDNSVFPGHQGGPFMNSIAGKAWALWNAQTRPFLSYQKRILRYAKQMEEEFISLGCVLVTGGTDTHMLLIDTLKSWGIDGASASKLLEKNYIYANHNLIPFDSGTAQKPSGLRIGTAWIAHKKYLKQDIKKLAKKIVEICTKK